MKIALRKRKKEILRISNKCICEIMFSIIWNRKTIIENKINNQRLKGNGRGDSKKPQEKVISVY